MIHELNKKLSPVAPYYDSAEIPSSEETDCGGLDFASSVDVASPETE